MDIDLPALGFSLIFTFTVFILIWLLEGFLERRERRLGKPDMDLHVSTSERVHVDMPSSGKLLNVEESEPTSPAESTQQPSLVCPECHSNRVVKRGFADRAHRKQRYLCRHCHVTFLGKAAVEPSHSHIPTALGGRSDD